MARLFAPITQRDTPCRSYIVPFRNHHDYQLQFGPLVPYTDPYASKGRRKRSSLPWFSIIVIPQKAFLDPYRFNAASTVRGFPWIVRTLAPLRFGF